MLVVLDSDEGCHAPLGVAQSYAPSTVLLRSWAADPFEIDAEVVQSATAEPTVSEALQIAAQRGIAWVGMRRSLIPPQELLGELLTATAEHSTEETPGFAVLLAEGEPKPITHILGIVNRGDGPMSGMLAYAGVALADASGAKLDMLVIGSEEEDPHTEDEFASLAISRERDVYEAARQRAHERGVAVNWITAASVTDLWPMVADQISQHPYDLVIDDLGDVSLAKLRQRGSIQEALSAGAVGEVPLRLLTETSLPLVLVIDEIRMRWAPERVLRAGAVAAVSLGVVGGTMAASAAAAPASLMASSRKPHATGDLSTDLQLAIDAAQQEATGPGSVSVDVSQRAAATDTASRGVASTGARAAAEQVGHAVVPTWSPTTTSFSVATTASATADSEAPESTKKSSESTKKSSKKKSTTQDSTPTAPKGGATSAQVANARAAAAKAQSALRKARAAKERTHDAVADLAGDLARAESAAIVALDNLEAATLSHAEAAHDAEAVTEAASGLGAVLPGSPSDSEVRIAALAEEAAAERLDSAIATGEETLDTLEGTEQALTKTEERLEARQQSVQASRTDYEHSEEKAKVYRASLASTRQSPVAKGKYRLTARFGDSGSYWSSGFHTGLDFAGSSGTSIKAAASGTVVSAGWAGAYGNKVVIRHADGIRTTYNHMSAIMVSPGQKVSTGDQVGRMGTTGNSTGSHLHFEVIKKGDFVDPETWLGL